MVDNAEGESKTKLKLKELRCRRTGRMYAVAEHVVCPYCSGDAAVIEAGGDYDRFCEFEAGQDPVQFGFPADISRNERG
jgi:hypothetical protein